MTFEERCRICEQCIPESEFRNRMKQLHDEMLDRIAWLESACESLSADN